jgi:acetyltransferase
MSSGLSHTSNQVVGAPPRGGLEPFLTPRSIAMICAGRSDTARAVLSNLLAISSMKFYLVNPGQTEILGTKSHTRISELGESVDLAVVVVPGPAVPGIIGECVDAQVKAAVVISPESGRQPERLEFESQILLHLKRGPMRLIGPGSVGLINPRVGLNASCLHTTVETGSVAFLSQSGALLAGILDWSQREQVGFSAVVSTGSMLDVDWGGWIDYFGNDPYTKSIVLFMESVGNARSFLSAAQQVSLSKPIIVLKAKDAPPVDTSPFGITTDDALDAAFRRCGVLRVPSIADLFYMADVLSKQPRPRGPRLAIVSNAGASAMLASDALAANGAELAVLSPESLHQLETLLPQPQSARSNHIEVPPEDSEGFVKAVDVAVQDPASDGVLAILAPQALAQAAETARGMQVHAKCGKPLLISWMGGDPASEDVAILNAAGIPTFSYPDTAARAFAYMWRHTYNLRGLYETPALVEDSEATNARISAGGILRQALASGRQGLDGPESKHLLALYGIPVVDTPIAEIGGYELTLGSAVHPQFGPLILFGASGIMGEIYRDRALAVPPLNTTLAHRLLEQTRIFAALKGLDGRKPANLSALEEVLVRFSRLVVEQPRIKEIGVNLMATSDKVLAVDASVLLHSEEITAEQLPQLAIRPYPTQYVWDCRLKDGTPVTIRPIRPEDEPLMVKFHATLSERSVYLRYFCSLSLSARVEHERLVRICFASYDRGFALVADRKIPETGCHEILGVGRFSDITKKEAEAAVLVSDNWQGRGLGTQLLAGVVHAARAENFQRLSGEILRDNLVTQAMFKKAGFRLQATRDLSSVAAHLDL